MPKQLYKIIAFHGGLATGPDPRDILDGQLSDATDVMVDNVGKIRMLGGSAVHKATAHSQAGYTGNIEAGYGLFYFSHDYTKAQEAGTNGATTGDNYLALWDDQDGEVWIYSEAIDDSNGATGWDDDTGNPENAPIIVGTGTPVFYMADGSLRVADATFTRTTKWYGYIERSYWPDIADAESVDGWYSYDNTIAKSPVGDGDDNDLFRHNDADGDWGLVSAPDMDVAGTVGMTVSGYKYAAGGMRGFKDFYKTAIYDGNQESLPRRLSGLDTQMDDIWENAKKRFKVYVHTGGGDFYNKRVTGTRIYYRSVDSADNPHGDMYLLLECDFKYGVRRNSVDTYRAWAQASTNIVVCPPIEFSSWPKTEVYGSRSGYSQDLHSIDAKYKTAVVANRRTYIGNVKFTDKGGTEIVKGDAIIKSPVNSFDVFPATNILEATVNDGDEIVKLEVYADRLLQFKKHKLEILNISQAVEFLEETFHHKGIGHQAAVCNTDYGIAWVNKLGCYLFDGQKVIDLLEKGGIQIISESDWNTFTNVPATKEPMIGYVPNKRQLIVVDDISTNGDGAIFLYDMVTKSWVKGSDDTIQDQVKTNFVNDWDGNLVWVHTSGTSTPAQWDDTSTSSSSLSIKTKDIDFGNPGQKKTVYKVYISYKGDGSSTTVKYGVNGETDAGDLYAFDSANLANKSSSENLETWHIATLKPGTASQAKDIYSFQIILGGTGGATFEINDMSIVYRLKGIR